VVTCVTCAGRIFFSLFVQDIQRIPALLAAAVFLCERQEGEEKLETINDPKRLDTYVRQHGIDKLFSAEPPRFFLLRYAPGELLTTPFSPSKYLQFVVEGALVLYEMPDEESTVTLQTTYNEIEILGDLELLDTRFTPFFVEAKTEVCTLAVHLDQYRRQLLNDPVFLRYLCRNLADKLNGAVVSNRHGSLRQRVIMSLRYAEIGASLSNIGHIARSLNVSTRQLIRVLKDLCDEGVLEHPEKGVYRILRKPELIRRPGREEEQT